MIRWICSFLVVLTVLPGAEVRILACTRAVYLGPGGEVITSRSMDWKVDVGTNLWILPREMERNGEVGAQSLEWRSKYGSVVATGYDVSTTDGMNEKGMVANLLWLVESEYPKPVAGKPGLAISLWAQWVLDKLRNSGRGSGRSGTRTLYIGDRECSGRKKARYIASLDVGCDRRQRDCGVHRWQTDDSP
ncbi:linear amide C-N hydrolase [Tunturiibacter gelidoferens]|uniref:Linear amide C-N hydrolase n=1 Tax=Tunturiibacter gelidiferens TaxID=3069689 RepID=A0AAU7Z2Q6_9BACT